MAEVIDFKKLKLGRRPILPAIGAAIGVLLLIIGAGWFSLTQEVGPQHSAIRQVYFGPVKGISKKVHGPGLHMVIPGYERLHLFPRTMDRLEFNSSERGHTRGARDSISIQTSDGYNVSVDVTVLYRVVDPYLVVTKVGFGNAFQAKVVVPRSDKILRQILGKLVAEDFFNDNVRIEAGERVRMELQTELKNWGIQVWGVLVRSYKYDDRFQNIIETRKIEDQRLFKNQAEKLRETRRAEMAKALAELTADIEVLQQVGSNRIRIVNADANTYYRTKVAEGKKEVDLAVADSTKWEREALEKSGAGNLVGLEMAEALGGTQVIMISTTGSSAMNPLNLDALLEGW
ncbi:MAG: regulator of protease activity HflC (stomatin/prohibitin superfamily) [Kiritimatiellia bacterium]|jgi:regulator of protease activity HflC (stomatin/prohibitin superfamily)